jgi:Flp pilus assembly protein TadD
MFFSERICGIHLRTNRLRPYGVVEAGLGFLLLISTLLIAQASGISVTGTVKTEAGAAVAGTRVFARNPAGKMIASALTDNHGLFQLQPLQPGTYIVEVELHGKQATSSKTVELREEKTVELNFVISPAQADTKGKSDLLGPVTFYNKSDFKQGELQNPSGGGGYSNGASLQAREMLKQYLAAPKLSTSEVASGTDEKPPASVDSHEAEIERSGRALLAKKDYTQAITVFEKGAALHPHSERLQMGLGLSLYGAGKYREAAEKLVEASQMAPDDPAPVVMLSEALQYAPDVKAAGTVRRFSELHPGSAQGHYAYGLSMWNDFRADRNQESLASAQSEFERAVVLDPNDAGSHLQLGIIYDEQKATVLAVREYEDVTRLDPGLAAAHYRLAQDYELLGQKDKATAELALYQKLNGKNSH